MVDDRYEAFSMADPVFYDAMHSVETAGASFSTAERQLPDGWQRDQQDDWFVFTAVERMRELPPQGWKIHASAALDQAEKVLDEVWDYCISGGINFKFLRSKSALTARVSKYAPRGYSGKFVTIYPADDTECERILRELGERLDGVANPYILSDLRWGNGPLYVRYGAFAMRYCVDENGVVVEAIADDTGKLVPDRRGPVFRTPSWVALPEFLRPAVAARDAVKLDGIPYRIDHPVHFSNGGGIYVGTDTRTGDRVVLKEGRPYAGLDGWGHDAVTRLEREYAILRKLDGIPGIPRAHDLFWLGEHRFLVMDHIDGQALSKSLVARYPLIDPSASADDYASFTEWAVDLHRQLETTIKAIHERGVVYGDLHLFNVIIEGDDRVVLLDFEVASLADEPVEPGLGNQGFSAPRGVTGIERDLYALACMKLALFLPMTNLLWLHRPKAKQYAEIIAEHFPVPAAFLTEAVEVIAPSRTPLPPSPRIEPDRYGWPALRADLVRAIVASATPERTDRLFPGDVEQFALGGLGLAYGAAGVLHALSVTGGARSEQFEEWLIERAKNPASGTRLGLYEGLHGAAYVLDHLGYQQEALDVVDICLDDNWPALGPDLAGGLAGIGLNLLHLAEKTGEPTLRLTGLRAAELVAEQLGDDVTAEFAGEVSGGADNQHAGLMRGRSGQALLLLRAYDDTGDASFLDRAAIALRRDLRRCVLRENGVLEVNEGWRSMPYLDVGSIGIGLALDEYLVRRPDDFFATAVKGVERAASSEMYILPGLFSGRAGILAYLAGRSANPLRDPQVARQVRGLAWHVLPYAGGLAFPGTALLRLSMDLATGTAGVLLALGMVLHDQPVGLPLLTAKTPQSPAPTGVGSPIPNL